MKRPSFAFILAIAAVLFRLTAGAVEFQVVRDRGDCLYRCGETAVFTVTALETNGTKAVSGRVKWTLDSYNVGAPLREGEVDLAVENPFAVKGSLDRPGFLQLQLKADGFKVPFNTGGWSVGFEPERIRKGSPSPEDFDSFWAAGRRRLAAEVPLDVRIVPYPEKSTADWDYFRISFATFGRRVYGFFSTPKDRSKRYPARVQVASAGWGNWTNFQPGKKDMVFLWFSVYPFEPSWDWKTDGTTEKFNAMNAACRKKWGAREYGTAGIAGNRDDYFFYAVTLGIDRAIDWLARYPLVNEKDLTYYGGSQSGGLGLYLVGLNHRFRKAVTSVPALTDTMAHRVGRVSSWPRSWESARTADEREAMDRNLPYYDAANFASRVKCPIRLTVGFRDGTCFPPCVYAAYNEIRVADKAIMHAVDSGHGMPDKVVGPLGVWLKE